MVLAWWSAAIRVGGDILLIIVQCVLFNGMRYWRSGQRGAVRRRRARPPDLEPALHRFDNNTIVENLNYVL